MNSQKRLNVQRRRRVMRVRKRVRGDAASPRLSVFRSQKHIYVQAIDDEVGKTLASASSRSICGIFGGTVDHAKEVGTAIADALLKLDIKRVRFDRGSYRFHGRVRALADAARKKGLEF